MKLKKLLSLALTLIIVIGSFSSVLALGLSAATVSTVLNGGFESGAWLNGTVTDEEKFEGTKSGIITKNGNSFTDTPISTFQPESGKSYVLSFWAKASDDYSGKFGVRIYLRKHTSSGNSSIGNSTEFFISNPDSNIVPKKEWTEYRFNITSDLNQFSDEVTHIRTYVNASGTTVGKLYIDNFNIEEYTVSDGDFESKNWTSLSSITYTKEDAVSGFNSLKIGNGAKDTFIDTPISQWAPESGKSYYLSFYAKATSDFAGKVVPKAMLRNPNGTGGFQNQATTLDLTAANTTANGTTLTPNTSWTEYRYNVTYLFNKIDNTTTAIRLYITVSNCTAGYLYLDDFKFVEGTCTDGMQETTGGEDPEIVNTPATADGSFEKKLWNGQNTKYGIVPLIYDTAEKHEGTQSYKIDGTVWQAFSDTPVSTWSPDPSKKYYLSFWAKSTDDFGGKVVPKVQFRLVAGGGGASSLDLTAADTSKGIAPGNEWVEFRYDVTYLLKNFDSSVSDLRINITTTNYTGGYLYLDDFKFVEGTCTDGKQEADYGFENKSWVGQNASYGIVSLTPNYDTSEKHSGKVSFKSDSTVWQAYSDTSVDIFAPDKEKIYYLSYWAKATSDFAGKVIVKVSYRLKAGGGGSINNYDLTAANTTSNGTAVAPNTFWTEYRYDVTDLFSQFSDDISAIRISIYTTNLTAGAVYLDDFKFYEGGCKAGKQSRFDILVEGDSSNDIGNITVGNNAISETFKFTNNSHSAKAGTITAVLKNYKGEALEEKILPFELEANESMTNTLEFADKKYGTYNIHFTVNDGGEPYEIAVVPVSKIKVDSTADAQYGLCVHKGHFDSENRNELFEKIASSGCGWIRTDLAWYDVEKEAGVYTDTVTDLISTASANGINVNLILGKGNSLYDSGAFPTSDGAVEAFANYCAAVAKANKGIVKSYEIWNEYNNEDDGLNQTQKAVNYVKLLKAAYNAIKAEDPDAKVVGGAAAGYAEAYITAILNNGGANYMDAVSIHPYSKNGEYFVSPESANFGSNSRTFRQLADRYDLELWATEIGWTTADLNVAVTEQEQAEFLLRSLLLNKENGLYDNIFFYDYADDGTDTGNVHQNFGLLYSRYFDTPYASKNSFVALNAFASTLNGFEFVETVDAVSSVAKVLKFTNTKTNKDLYAYWTSLDTTGIKFDFADKVTFIDMYGNSFVPASELYVASGSPRFIMADSSNTLNSITLENITSPVLSFKRGTEIEVALIDGMEYSIDGVNWQSSNVFSGLTIGSTVNIYQRFENTVNSSSPVSTKIVPVGDVNNDTVMNGLDLAAIRKILMGSSIEGTCDYLSADTNADGEINIKDLVRAKKILS